MDGVFVQAHRAARAVRSVAESYLGRFLLFIAILLQVTLMVDGHETGDFPSWTPDMWSALAGVVTASVAVVAVIVAMGQLRDARLLRWEQAMPYVVGYLEPDSTDPKIVYFVLKNLGTTAATSLRLSFTPAPSKSNGVGGGHLIYPKQLPALVPGQEWRTFWDFTPFRNKQRELSDTHIVQITYVDSRNKEHEAESVLDWKSLMGGRTWVSRNSIHSVGTSLKSIDKSLERIASEVQGNAAKVASLDEVSQWFDVFEGGEENQPSDEDK